MGALATGNKWQDYVKIEQVVLRISIPIWEMDQSDWGKTVTLTKMNVLGIFFVIVHVNR